MFAALKPLNRRLFVAAASIALLLRTRFSADGFATHMTSAFCEKPLVAGEDIMSATAAVNTDVTLRVNAAKSSIKQQLQSGDIVQPGEVLEIDLADYPADSKAQFLFEVDNAVFFDGSCGGRRIANKKNALIVVPLSTSTSSSGGSEGNTITIRAAMAQQYGTVSISKDFTLTVQQHINSGSSTPREESVAGTAGAATTATIGVAIEATIEERMQQRKLQSEEVKSSSKQDVITAAQKELLEAQTALAAKKAALESAVAGEAAVDAEFEERMAGTISNLAATIKKLKGDTMSPGALKRQRMQELSKKKRKEPANTAGVKANDKKSSGATSSDNARDADGKSSNKHVQQRQRLFQKDKRPLPPHMQEERRKKKRAFRDMMVQLSFAFGVFLCVASCGGIGVLVFRSRTWMVQQLRLLTGRRKYND